MRFQRSIRVERKGTRLLWLITLHVELISSKICRSDSGVPCNKPFPQAVSFARVQAGASHTAPTQSSLECS
jgi:hypothetical protein